MFYLTMTLLNGITLHHLMIKNQPHNRRVVFAYKKREGI